MADNNNKDWTGLAIVGLLSAIGAILGFKFLSGSHHDKNAGMYHHHFGRPSSGYDMMGGTGHAGSMKFNKSDDSCLPCAAKRNNSGLY